MSKLIIANWKMNPQSEWEAMRLARQSDCEGLVIAPPFPFLESVGKTLKKAALGAQDLFWESSGPYTGEVSAEELKAFGVKYVIVGHSERRRTLGETDEMIAKKIKAAMEHGLIPILCVGETKEERDAGKAQEAIKRELWSGLSQLRTANIEHRTMIVAYEPIWAIGTGAPDTAEDIIEMAGFIRQTIVAGGPDRNVGVARILYGGSVTSENAESFLSREEIGGALVGGASLDAKEIVKIVEIARKYS